MVNSDFYQKKISDFVSEIKYTIPFYQFESNDEIYFSVLNTNVANIEPSWLVDSNSTRE